jgi:hypothetical protein
MTDDISLAEVHYLVAERIDRADANRYCLVTARPP